MSWVTGLIIAIIGSFCGALGDNMVRKAYIDTESSFKMTYILKHPLFIIGIILTTVIDPITTVAALGFAPSAVVTPFAAVHIFLTLVIARIWLKEAMGYWEYLGSFLMISGVIIIVLFAGKDSPISSLDTFKEYLNDPVAIIYFIVVIFCLVSFCSLSTDSLINMLPKYNYEIQRFSIPASSGLFGGNTNLAAKVFTVILGNLTHPTDPSYKDWRSYIVVFATLCLALGQLYYLNLGLKSYPAVYVIPITNSFLVATGTIGGVMFLKEMPDLNGNFGLLMMFFGLLLIISGIVIFSWKHSPQPLLHTDNELNMDNLSSVSFSFSESHIINQNSFKNLTNSKNILASKNLSFISHKSYASKSIALPSCGYLTIHHTLQEQIQASKLSNLSYMSCDSSTSNVYSKSKVKKLAEDHLENNDSNSQNNMAKSKNSKNSEDQIDFLDSQSINAIEILSTIDDLSVIK